MTSPTQPFRLVADYQMTGDQPQAVDKLVEGLQAAEAQLSIHGQHADSGNQQDYQPQ